MAAKQKRRAHDEWLQVRSLLSYDNFTEKEKRGAACGEDSKGGR